MTQYDDAAAGMRAAIEAMRAIADGDNARALALLNGTTHAQATWAAATLLETTVQAVKVAVKGDMRRFELALRNAADQAEAEDVLMTQVALILNNVKEA